MYQRGLKSMVYKFFDKQTESGAKVKNKAKTNVNEVIGQEEHKQVINKFKDNIWTAYVAEIVYLPSFNYGVKYLPCEIFVLTKYP